MARCVRATRSVSTTAPLCPPDPLLLCTGGTYAPYVVASSELEMELGRDVFIDGKGLRVSLKIGHYLGLLFVICFLLAGCGQRDSRPIIPSPFASPQVTSHLASEETSAQPSREIPLGSVGSSGLSKSGCDAAVPNRGAVKGRLFLLDGQPAVGSVLYLAEYMGLDTATPLVVLDPAQHAHVEVGEGGAFCFEAVAPGTYGLIVWDAVESVLLNDPSTGYSLSIRVTANQVIDLGIVHTPIP